MNDFDNSNVSTDGIFLIRPSSSRIGFYALEISKDGNVVCFLIFLILIFITSSIPV